MILIYIAIPQIRFALKLKKKENLAILMMNVKEMHDVNLIMSNHLMADVKLTSRSRKTRLFSHGVKKIYFFAKRVSEYLLTFREN